VRDLDLQVPCGTVFGLLGPNGAGKTTTIMLLLGIIKPSGGTFSLFGRPMTDVGVRRRVGYVPEKFQLPATLRVSEFLRFHGRILGLGGLSLETRITFLLQEVGLAERAAAGISELSKGMQQRLAIAQSLLNDPDLVILDEPSSALDPVGRIEVKRLIEGLKSRGKTVLLNSHILSDVEEVCDSVAILQRGKLERQGPVASLSGGGLTVRVRMAGSIPDLQSQLGSMGTGLRVVSGGEVTELEVSVPNEEAIPAIAEAIHQQGALLYALSPQHESLESLFLRVVKEGK